MIDQMSENKINMNNQKSPSFGGDRGGYYEQIN